jgi:3-oxoacyl-[acyl-carrier protein] reductase
VNSRDNGRCAIVTGASKGIGLAIAEQLAKHGYSLLLAARSENTLKEIASDFSRTHGVRVLAFPADLRELQRADEAVSRAVSDLGGLDLLVNCAGATKSGDFFSFAQSDFDDGFALKFYAAVNLTRAAWPHLVRSKSGHIVNIIGIRSRTPLADYVIGGSVNSALLNFTKAMADRGLRDGVRVNGINPGYIETDRARGIFKRIAEQDNESEQRVRLGLIKQNGIERFGRPEEVAALVAFMDSKDGEYFHGSIVDLDGGATKGI